MTRWTLLIAAAMVGLSPGEAARAAVDYKIVTASERGTYIQIGRDLAKFVAPSADINLEAVPSAGSAENVQRLRYEPGVKLALVQSDVYQAFLDRGAEGNQAAATLIRPLRVVMPLYNEEIYFVARADSPLNFVHEIKGAKIAAGALGSGTALTTTTLYRQMFGTQLPDTQASFMSNEEALVKLIDDKSVDVVVVVAGQPAKLFVDMKPEARQFIKLLRFDPDHPGSKAALKTYFPATIRSSHYPNLLPEDMPGIAVKAFLVTYAYQMQDTIGYLSAFARSLCANFATLQKDGHPKWKEVALSLPALGRGWSYYRPMAQQLRNCGASGAAAPVRTPGSCTQHERVLGLCQEPQPRRSP
jgi:TRAP transporter TAXI family solute receptor